MNQSASLLWGDDGGHQMSVIPLSDTSRKPKRFPAVTASGLRRPIPRVHRHAVV